VAAPPVRDNPPAAVQPAAKLSGSSAPSSAITLTTSDVVDSPAEAADESGGRGGEARRYHIIVGDTCAVCRAASRISFPRERPPQIPVAGCREADGCRCSLPIFAEELQAVLATPERALPARVLARPKEGISASTRQPEPGPSPPARRARAPVPDWAQPAPITERRHHDLADLTTEYYQRRIQGIRIGTQSGCCRVCADVADSIYEPSAVPTLPVVGCHHGWYCTCMYEAEPLPLDARGRAALETLARQERDAALRRRGIARFAPRPLHEIALAFSLLLAGAALWQLTDTVPPAPWEVLLPLTLAVICAAMTVGAILRLRWMVAPAFFEAVSGAVTVFVAVRTAVQFPLSVGLPLEPAADLRRVHLLLSLSGYGFGSLPAPERLVAAGGLALLVAGIAGLILGPGYQQRAVLRETEVRDVKYSRRRRSPQTSPRAERGQPLLALPGYRGRRRG